MPNGDVLVAKTNAPPRPDDRTGIRGWYLRVFMHEQGADDPSANRITLLRDADGDGVAEMRSVLLKGLNSPFGMALVGNTLYVATTDAIVSFPYRSGQTEITAPPTKLVDLPAGTINHHWTRGLIPTPTDRSSTCRSARTATSASAEWTTRSIAPRSGKSIRRRARHRVYASGMRNPVGMSWVPGSNALWVAVNEREQLGGDLPPDYMTAVKDGAFYGWPYSYFGEHVDARVLPARPDLVAKAVVPDYALGAHTASLGIAYAAGTSLPSKFNNGMIVTQHGSWNRIPRSGYRVVFVPFNGGKPAGPPVVLLTGFLNDDENAQGRPVGVTIDKRGAVLVADDAGNTVWRVTGTQPRQVVETQDEILNPTPASVLLKTYATAVTSAEATGDRVPRTGVGNVERRCVDVNDTPNPRSGEFSVGGFNMYGATWHQGAGKLAWKPLHPDASAPLTVRVWSLDNPGAPVEFKATTMSGSIADNTASYTVDMRLPRAGSWLLTAEAGPNWGCFLYTLR